MPKYVSFVSLASLALLAWLTPAAAPHGEGLEVRTSLDGKTVLPHRIRWLGFPSLSRDKVSEVAFLIDGKVRWIEHGAPYSYSDDGGYLVTSWLSPGRHRFTVRVRSTDVRTATHTVVARVLPAPVPPATLAGAWQRDVPEAVGNSPAGRYTIIFERRWIQDRAPGKWNPKTSSDTGFGSIIDNDWVPGPKTFEIVGGVTFGPLDDEKAEGGWWCEPWGPKATYSWSVRGETLTLAPVRGVDPCSQRGAIYTGEWTRAR